MPAFLRCCALLFASIFTTRRRAARHEASARLVDEVALAVESLVLRLGCGLRLGDHVAV